MIYVFRGVWLWYVVATYNIWELYIIAAQAIVTVLCEFVYFLIILPLELCILYGTVPVLYDLTAQIICTITIATSFKNPCNSEHHKSRKIKEYNIVTTE